MQHSVASISAVLSAGLIFLSIKQTLFPQSQFHYDSRPTVFPVSPWYSSGKLNFHASLTVALRCIDTRTLSRPAVISIDAAVHNVTSKKLRKQIELPRIRRQIHGNNAIAFQMHLPCDNDTSS